MSYAVSGLKAGDVLGPYKIEGALGHGGMGIVFRASHVEDGSRVALKTVREPSAHRLTALRREIRALSRLRIPGVVNIVDHGVSDGLPWYAMELLTGSTLEDLMSKEADDSSLSWGLRKTQDLAAPTEPISPEERLRQSAPSAPPPSLELLPIIAQVCSTLSYVHANGFVHRDLKPSNIFISERGFPTLVDFGIVTQFVSARGKESLEVGGEIAGSVAYMSPEQIRGEFVDARADLYSLGCILYECMTGSVPFVGQSQLEVMNGHLYSDPDPPSSRDSSIPRALDELVLRLLSKQPRDRIGYADVVASSLNNLAKSESSSRPTTQAVTYLYRPAFVRREMLDSTLEDELASLKRGRGGFLLVAGESGIGKTRSAMELASVARAQGAVVLVGECLPLGLDHAHDGALAPFRSIFRGVADICRDGGANKTAALLGNRARLLADIDPAFRGVKWQAAQLDLGTVSADQARRVLFNALRDTLFAVARSQLTLIIIDDLQWADELSLELLRELSEADLDQLPLLLVATHRIEGRLELLDRLRVGEKARRISIDRLDQPQVEAMVAEMLALSRPPKTLLDRIHARSRGVPFLVSEYLAAELEAGALRRNGLGHWVHDAEHHQPDSADGAAELPVIRDLFLGRLQSLSPTARHVVTMAAVFGHDVTPDYLRLAAGTSDDDFADALQTLRRQQLLDDTAAGTLRFCHEQVRLVVYDAASERRRELHERAAEILERFDPARAKGNNAIIAHHFSCAERPERAYFYWREAGNEYRATWRNQDAIACYASAVRELERAIAAGPQLERWDADMAELLEGQGDGESLAASPDAIYRYRRALGHSSQRAPHLQARLHRKIGKAFSTQKDHANATLAQQAAAMLLRDDPPVDPTAPEWWEEWAELQLDVAWGFYWKAELASLTRHIETCRPKFDARATYAQRARLLQCLLTSTMRSENYRLSAAAVSLAQEASEMSDRSNHAQAACEALFLLGFARLWHGDSAGAARDLRRAVHDSQQQGNTPIRVRSLTYLSVAERKLGNVEECRRIAQVTIELAREAEMTDYLGAVQGNLAWAELQRGTVEEALVNGRAAIESFNRPPALYPFQGLARWPLAVAFERLGNPTAALQTLEPLLDPRQQRMAEGCEERLRQLLSTPYDLSTELRLLFGQASQMDEL